MSWVITTYDVRPSRPICAFRDCQRSSELIIPSLTTVLPQDGTCLAQIVSGNDTFRIVTCDYLYVLLEPIELSSDGVLTLLVLAFPLASPVLHQLLHVRQIKHHRRSLFSTYCWNALVSKICRARF